jgi:hypothetical protein
MPAKTEERMHLHYPAKRTIMTAEQLMLDRRWGVWFSGRVSKDAPTRNGSRNGSGKGSSKGIKQEDSFTAPKLVSSFGSIATYWTIINTIPVPSQLIVDFNLFIFQQGVDPLWEHPDNKKGGRWTISIDSKNPEKIDKAWLNTHLALVGETLDPSYEIVGITLARRRNYTRISIWTRNKEKTTEILHIGDLFKKATGATKLEYQDHGEGFENYRHVIE